MRSTLILLVMLALGFNASANENKLQYVSTDSDTIICEKIYVGLVKIKCRDIDGNKHEFDLDDVNTYQNNEGRFDKKPVHCNNTGPGKFVFMKLVDCHNGIFIYSYIDYRSNLQHPPTVVSLYHKNEWIKNFANGPYHAVYAYINNLKCKEDQVLTDK